MPLQGRSQTEKKIFIGIRQFNGSDVRVGLLRETVVFLCRAKVPLDLTLHTEWLVCSATLSEQLLKGPIPSIKN